MRQPLTKAQVEQLSRDVQRLSEYQLGALMEFIEAERRVRAIDDEIERRKSVSATSPDSCSVN